MTGKFVDQKDVNESEDKIELNMRKARKSGQQLKTLLPYATRIAANPSNFFIQNTVDETVERNVSH